MMGDDGLENPVCTYVHNKLLIYDDEWVKLPPGKKRSKRGRQARNQRHHRAIDGRSVCLEVVVAAAAAAESCAHELRWQGNGRV